MCLESTTISINLKIKINMEYIDKTKINMKYIDKNKEGRRIMHIQKQEITLNINYSIPYHLGKKSWYNLGKNMINRKHICALNSLPSPIKF